MTVIIGLTSAFPCGNLARVGHPPQLSPYTQSCPVSTLPFGARTVRFDTLTTCLFPPALFFGPAPSMHLQTDT